MFIFRYTKAITNMYTLQLTTDHYTEVATLEDRPILLKNNKVGFKTLDQYSSYCSSLRDSRPRLGKLPILNLYLDSI